MKSGIIGFGVLGEQIYNFILECNKAPIELIIFDDLKSKINVIKTLPFRDIYCKEFSEIDFYIGIGYKHLEFKYN